MRRSRARPARAPRQKAFGSFSAPPSNAGGGDGRRPFSKSGRLHIELASEVEADADGVDGHAVVDLEILVGDQPILEQALNERAFIDVEFDARLRTGQPRIISPVSIPAKAANKGLETPERRLQVDRSSRRVLEIIVHMTAEGCEKGLT